MAKENVKLFNEKIIQSDELKAKLRAAQEAYTGDKSDKERIATEILLPLANEAGLPFTIEELKAVEEEMSVAGELSEDELTAVAGGHGGHKCGGCFIIGLGYKGKDTFCLVGGAAKDGTMCFVFGIL